MTRTAKEFTVRRNEILDVAQRLVYSEGYEQMTIQDILDELHISKGAFYHYFDSKQALLEALTERLLGEAESILTPIRDDPQRSAIEKLNAYFDSGMNWKTAQKAYMMALVRGWYSDDNAIVRQKLTHDGYARIAPFIETILVQGVQEGSISIPYPRQTAQVVVALMTNLGDTLAGMIIASQPGGADMLQVEVMVAAFTGALERILGTAPGLLMLLEMDAVKEWFI